MKLFTVEKCKEILKEKYNITKGISWHTKTQLNGIYFLVKIMHIQKEKIKNIIQQQIW